MEFVAQHNGQSIQNVGSRRPLAGQTIVEKQRCYAGVHGNLFQRKITRVNGASQLATQSRLVARILAHLVAGLQVWQFCRDLGAVTDETLLLCRCKGPSNSFGFAMCHGRT